MVCLVLGAPHLPDKISTCQHLAGKVVCVCVSLPQAVTRPASRIAPIALRVVFKIRARPLALCFIPSRLLSSAPLFLRIACTTGAFLAFPTHARARTRARAHTHTHNARTHARTHENTHTQSAGAPSRASPSTPDRTPSRRLGDDSEATRRRLGGEARAFTFTV